jgi:hypothetical protein
VTINHYNICNLGTEFLLSQYEMESMSWPGFNVPRGTLTLHAPIKDGFFDWRQLNAMEEQTMHPRPGQRPAMISCTACCINPQF